jgi:uncharacterized membrane protein
MGKLDQLFERTETTTSQTVCRVLLGMFLLFTGTGHLTFLRDEFPAQVPDWVKLDIDLVVVLSGIVELLLGACLVALSRYKVLVGIAAALFFIAIFPGNISQFLNHRDAFGLDTDTKRGVRLLFQPVLVGWALWASGAWKVLKRGNRK